MPLPFQLPRTTATWTRGICFGSLVYSAGIVPATAQQLPSEQQARESVPVFAHSQTTLRVFQRGVGPRGSIAETDTLVPLFEYWSLSAPAAPSLVGTQPASFELSGWLDATLGERRHEQPLVGDLTAAWVKQPIGPVAFTLGRQVSFGGAARYVRFDGATLDWRLTTPSKLESAVSFYGGYTVLPRWDARPGYHHLGSVADTLVREDNALPEAGRSGDGLFGGRARISHSDVGEAGLSFHEQYEQGRLFRRNFGFDVQVQATEATALTGDLVLDADELTVVDANVWLDWELSEQLWGAVSYLHVNPQLYLSRQSVFSVFDSARFDEAGVELSAAPLPRLSVTGRSFVEWFEAGRLGNRSELQTRAAIDPSEATLVGLTYGRVLVPEGGYHTIRNSVRRRLPGSLTANAEAYLYWYDRPIASRRSASVFSAHLEWGWARALRLMWGCSLAQTPTAASELQTLLRLSYDTSFLIGGAR